MKAKSFFYGLLQGRWPKRQQQKRSGASLTGESLIFLQLFNIHNKSKMLSKRNWTIEEDNFLRIQAGENQNRNWVIISAKLNQKFGGQNRSAKQCRERFINHASTPAELPFSNSWSQVQIKRLYQLYAKYGPRWTLISNQLANKSQNIVKNKFYCSLRKFARKMNNFLKSGKNKYKKEIRYDSIIRVFDAFDSFPDIPTCFKTASLQIREKILELTQLTIQDREIDDQVLGELAQDINKFNLQTRSYKAKKPKYLDVEKSVSVKQNNSQKLKMESESAEMSGWHDKKEETNCMKSANSGEINQNKFLILPEEAGQQNQKSVEKQKQEQMFEDELKKDFYFSSEYRSNSGNGSENIFSQMFPDEFPAYQVDDFLQ